MRRLVVLTGIAMLSLIGVSTANAQGADIFGVGGGHVIDNKVANFDLSAHSSPTRDFGHVSLRSEADQLDIYVDVDCVGTIQVFGDAAAAVVGGVVRRVSQPNGFGLEPGDRQLFTINDRGDPSDGRPVDSFYFNIFAGPPPNCETVVPFFLLPNVTEGNINIKTG
jgi:hypothetical protein